MSTESSDYRTEINAAVKVAQPGEFEPLVVGRWKIWPPVVLAPMAGVTNAAFRRLCREFGAGLYVSEMITARGLVEENKKTRRLAAFADDEPIRSLQLYGSDPFSLGEATRRLVAENAVDHLDLNFGCPVRKVTAAGGGAAIPVKPRLLERLVKSVVENAATVPVTIKVRMGINDEYQTYLDAGKIAEDNGCAAIGLHARTAAQLYDGEANWSAITKLKEHVSDIPVLGNGDLWECWDALRMMRRTGCDGVIVGRGCLGRPWLFRELADVFSGTRPTSPPNLGQVIDVLARHAQYLVDLFGPRQGVLEVRKWCGWYLKGFPGSARLRNLLFRIQSLEELTTVLHAVNGEEPFPQSALRARRCKRGGTQKVSLPPGYLDNLEDDQSPAMSRDPKVIAAMERALKGG